MIVNLDYRGWQTILANTMDGMTMTDIYKKSDITYSHINNITNVMIDKEILTVKKEGRRKIFTMTNKGYKIKEHLLNIMSEISIKLLFRLTVTMT